MSKLVILYVTFGFLTFFWILIFGIIFNDLFVYPDNVSVFLIGLVFFGGIGKILFEIHESIDDTRFTYWMTNDEKERYRQKKEARNRDCKKYGYKNHI